MTALVPKEQKPLDLHKFAQCTSNVVKCLSTDRSLGACCQCRFLPSLDLTHDRKREVVLEQIFRRGLEAAVRDGLLQMSSMSVRQSVKPPNLDRIGV